MNESRVGYMTIDMLADLTKDYIQLHIQNNRYIGDVQHLIKYQELIKYLK